MDSLWLWTIDGAKYSTMKYWSFVKSLFSKVIQLILRHWALRHIYDFTTLWWIITSFFFRPTGEDLKMVSSYLELNLCMCVCVARMPLGGKNLERQKLELDYYSWFCSAVLWGVKWPAFLSSSNKFKLIISKINNKMVRIDYLPRAIEKKVCTHTLYR